MNLRSVRQKRLAMIPIITVFSRRVMLLIITAGLCFVSNIFTVRYYIVIYDCSCIASCCRLCPARDFLMILLEHRQALYMRSLRIKIKEGQFIKMVTAV